MIKILGYSLIFWTGWLAFIAFFLMLITCVCVYCFVSRKCNALATKDKKRLIEKGESRLYWFEERIHKYHKYFVLIATVLIVVHVALALFRM